MTEGATAALTAVETAPSDNGSAQTGGWTDGFNEDTLAYIQNKGWDSPNSLLESYRNLEKFQGGSKNLVEIPGEDADHSALGSYYDRLGRPESPDGYGFEVPEGGDADLANWFGETAHQYGLSAKQANALFNEFNSMMEGRQEEYAANQRIESEQAIDSLRQEWGRDFDKQLAAGQKAVAALGYDEAALSALESKMGTAEMMKLFSAVGAKMGEDTFVDGQTSGSFGTSPAQARVQVSELKADPQFMDRYLSGDKAAIDKMQRLMSVAYG